MRRLDGEILVDDMPIWSWVASLPHLQELCIVVPSYQDVSQSSWCIALTDLKSVQQSSLRKFHINVFGVGNTPIMPGMLSDDDSSLRIHYNSLCWEAYRIDATSDDKLYTSLHPKCCVFIFQDNATELSAYENMPSTKQLRCWARWFPASQDDTALHFPEFRLHERGPSAQSAGSIPRMQFEDPDVADI